jgi:hypothetical protein
VYQVIHLDLQHALVVILVRILAKVASDKMMQNLKMSPLARVIHEFCNFVNKRLEESMFAFFQASTRGYAPCSGLTLSGGL